MTPESNYNNFVGSVPFTPESLREAMQAFFDREMNRKSEPYRHIVSPKTHKHLAVNLETSCGCIECVFYLGHKPDDA